MTEEHLSAIEATLPDSSHEWSEAQLVFIRNARKWLSEDKLIALDAQLRLNPPDVTWELLAAEIGDTESALKKRASRAKRILKTKLARLGYTTCSSI